MKKALVVVVTLVALVSGWYLFERDRVDEPDMVAQANRQDIASMFTAEDELTPTTESTGADSSTDTARPQSKSESGAVQAAAAPDHDSPFIHETDEVATVVGFVLDQEDAPIAGAAVRIIATGLDPQPGESASRSDYQRTFTQVLRSEEHAYKTVTDASGAFCVEGVRYIGMAIALAEAEGFGLESQMLMLNPNDDQEVTIHLSEGVPLEGRVLTALGAPVTDGIVSITAFLSNATTSTGPAGLNSSATTDQNGEFQLWLKSWGEEEAHACFEVSSSTHGKTSIRDITFLPGAYVTLKYQPMCSMHGTLSWSDGSPAEGCTVRLSGKMSLRKSNGGTVSYAGTEYTGTSGENGEYRIEDIDSAQVYSIDVLAPSGETTAAGRDPGSFVAGEDKQWDYRIEEHATLTGTVYGTETRLPLAERIVRCTRLNGSGSGSMSRLQTTTAADGTYSIAVHGGQGLYRVHADYGMVPNGPDFGGAEMNYIKEVALVPGRVETVDLELPEPWKCCFRITDAAGTPVEGATGHVQESLPTGSTNFYAYPYKSDASGRMEIAGLTPGATAAFRFEANGFVKVSLRISSGEVSGMEPITLAGSAGQMYPEQHVTLHRAASIAAVLVDSAGQPLAKMPLVVNFYLGNELIASTQAATDAHGAFSLQGGVPAMAGAIEIVASTENAAADSALGYMSPALDLPANRMTDLGTLVMN